MMQLIDFPVVGQGQHRSGWGGCLEDLQPLLRSGDLLLDDFCERTFQYFEVRQQNISHQRPWVGISHHPPYAPDWYLRTVHLLPLSEMCQQESWKQSQKHLRLLITLSQEAASWWRSQLRGIPVVCIKHPTGRPMLSWSPERFLQNSRKKVLQVGWFLRNTAAIYQLPELPGWERQRLLIGTRWEAAAHARNQENTSRRKYYGKVTELVRVGDTQYDLLLSENVVFLELWAATANNTIVECIMRNTPICVNRQAGPLDYLGRDYPLLYDDIREVPQLLEVDRILAAHQYLKVLDKWWIHGTMFAEQVRAACERAIPEFVE